MTKMVLSTVRNLQVFVRHQIVKTFPKNDRTKCMKYKSDVILTRKCGTLGYLNDNIGRINKVSPIYGWTVSLISVNQIYGFSTSTFFFNVEKTY